MKKYELECLSPEQIKARKSVFTKENNPYICETAGYEPLEVKFKRFEQNGIVAALNQSMFNSHDLREIYLNHPEFDITPEDELEDINEKMIAQQEYLQEMKEKKLGSFKETAESPSVSAAAEEEETPPEEETTTKK